jgi:type IV secretory pathway ATPase VirB11/archaellum biosynthesis ATPase
MKLKSLIKRATTCGIDRESAHEQHTSLVRPTQGLPQIKLRSQGPGPKTLADIKFHRFNLAICGGVKAGKTSLINSLLRAQHGQTGA